MLIFAAIYLQAHPAKTIELIKYIQTVRMGANRGYQWWYDYDIQFRLRKAINSSGSWGDIDSELWLMYMTPSPAGGITQSPKQVQIRKCYDYIFKGSCSKYPCSYGRICLKCNGQHPMLDYSGTNMPQASLAPAPNFRFPIRHQFQKPSFPTVRGQQTPNQSSPFRGSNSTTQRPRPKFQNQQYMGFRQNTN